MPVTTDPSARRFRIAALLSKGSSGRVYRAVMEEPDGSELDVALKLVGDEELRAVPLERLQEEARRFVGVEDRAIVRVDPPIRLGDKWALVMDLVTGVSLQRLTSLGPLPTGVVAEIVQEVARVLHKVWTAPGPDGRPLRLLHRDLKPSNLQLNAGGELRILDFGIAKADFRTRDAQTAAYATGTRAFVSPERVDGTDTPAGDVYSLGVTAHVLLGDGAAGDGDPAAELLAKLVAKMRADAPDARPSAQDVEKHCATIRRRASGETLRQWAERNVPRAIAVRFSDRVVGTVLTASEGAAPSGRSGAGRAETPPPTARASKSSPPPAAPAPAPPKRAASAPPAADRAATAARSAGRAEPARSLPPEPAQKAARPAARSRPDPAPSAPRARSTPTSTPAPTPPKSKSTPPTSTPPTSTPPKSTPPKSTPEPNDTRRSGRAASLAPETARRSTAERAPRAESPERVDRATPVTVARNLPDLPSAADLGPPPGRSAASSTGTTGTTGRRAAAPSLSPAPLFGNPKLHDAVTVAADAAAYSALLDGDDPRRSTAGALSLGTETVPADPPRPRPILREPRPERKRGGWVVGVVATGLLASVLVGGLALVAAASAWILWDDDEDLAFEAPAAPAPTGPGVLDDDELIELLSQAPLPPPTGLRLTFSSVPLGADVYVDDRPVGQTPVIGVKVTEGRHEVVMVSDFERVERTIDVGDRKPSRFVWRGGGKWEEHTKK